MGGGGGGGCYNAMASYYSQTNPGSCALGPLPDSANFCAWPRLKREGYPDCDFASQCTSLPWAYCNNCFNVAAFCGGRSVCVPVINCGPDANTYCNQQKNCGTGNPPCFGDPSQSYTLPRIIDLSPSNFLYIAGSLACGVHPVQVCPNACSGCATSSSAGYGIHSKKLAGRPFDSVEGEFIGLDSQGNPVVGHADGESTILVARQEFMRRGGNVALADGLRKGERLLVVGDLQGAQIRADAVAVSTRSFSGSISLIANWGVAVNGFYDGVDIPVYLSESSEVFDRDGGARTWAPSAVFVEQAVYGVGFIDSDGRLMGSRIWLYD